MPNRRGWTETNGSGADCARVVAGCPTRSTAASSSNPVPAYLKIVRNVMASTPLFHWCALRSEHATDSSHPCVRGTTYDVAGDLRLRDQDGLSSDRYDRRSQSVQQPSRD